MKRLLSMVLSSHTIHIRTALTLLVFAAIFPILVILLRIEVEGRNQITESTNQQTSLLVHQLKINQDALIESNRQLLALFSKFSSVQRLDPVRCSQILADMEDNQIQLTGLSVALPSGDIICSHPILKQPVNIAQHAYFQQTLRENRFVVSSYIIGRFSGKALVSLNYPVTDEHGRVIAVVSAGLDLDWMNQLLSKADLPDGSIAKVVDRNGVVLARFPNPQDWVGKSLADDPIIKTILQTGEDGSVEGVGADGIRRLYAFAPLQAGDENSAFIAVGIPSQQAFARAEESWRQDFLLFLSVALFAFLITWVGGVVLGKKTEMLINAIHRLAKDDLTVQSGVKSWISEINDLAASFDQMANQLSRQRIELTFAEARYRSLVEQLPAITFLVSIANGIEVLYLSPQAKNLFGFLQKGDEKNFWQDHIYPDDLPIVQKKAHKMQLGDRLDLEYRLVLPDGQVRWVSDVTTVIADENGQPTLLQGMLTDITERKNINEQLTQKIKEMACLQAITSVCMKAKSPNELLQAATKSVTEYLMVDNFGALLIDPASGTLRMHSAYHLPRENIESFNIPLGEGITGSTALDGIPRRLGDITTVPGYIRLDSQIRSELCVPIKGGEQIYGVLNLESARVNAYSEYDENLMLAIADQIALGLDRLRFEEELEAIATIDELSNLTNRRGFLKLARKELRHTIRRNDPLTMLVFDIDRFKQINDDYGHPIGDKAIQEVSERCEKILRESDIIGRLGGDEFAILLSNTDLFGAEKVAERIRQAIAQEFVTPKGPIEITLSIGIAQIINLKDCTIDDLFSLADEALYEAKRNGRDQVAMRTAASKNELP